METSKRFKEVPPKKVWSPVRERGGADSPIRRSLVEASSRELVSETP